MELGDFPHCSSALPGLARSKCGWKLPIASLAAGAGLWKCFLFPALEITGLLERELKLCMCQAGEGQEKGHKPAARGQPCPGQDAGAWGSLCGEQTSLPH